MKKNWPMVLAMLVILGLVWGCTTSRETVSFTNDKYKYTVSYPSSWQVNSVNIAPPPPAGTTFDGGKLAVDIVVWEQPSPNLAEQQHLKSKGWIEETILIAGETARLFTRPQTDTHTGLWKRLYFTHGYLTYEISLEVLDKSQAKLGFKVFENMIQSFRWSD
ncbi:hypothetical protein SY88_02790 [Clostridiales bacterium PH28_bin88]|nr:hypothetical protein SY88_02790 [Clostridiales bacterium PH28_bin88]